MKRNKIPTNVHIGIHHIFKWLSYPVELYIFFLLRSIVILAAATLVTARYIQEALEIRKNQLHLLVGFPRVLYFLVCFIIPSTCLLDFFYSDFFLQSETLSCRNFLPFFLLSDPLLSFPLSLSYTLLMMAACHSISHFTPRATCFFFFSPSSIQYHNLHII